MSDLSWSSSSERPAGARWGWFAVAAFLILSLSWNLGGYSLLEPDEGRNVEVAREMVRTNDWILPHLNGLPYLDKPAPYFAAVAIALKALGESEGAARASSLAFVLATMVLVWRLARRVGTADTGTYAAIALGTMPLALIYSRTVIPDPALLFVETATLAAAWRGFEEGALKVRWFALAWALMGLGIVTKGPVALIVPLLIVAIWALIADLPLRSFFAMHAWPWLLVSALPWLIAVSLRRPDFLQYAIVDESIGRLTSTQHQRTAPVWFFVPVLLLGTFPWTAPAIAGLIAASRRWRARKSAEGRAAAFAAAWALVPLVFFSIPKSKLPGYVLPALPGVAIGAALYLARGSARIAITRVAWIAAGCMLALAVLAGAGSPFAGKVATLAPRAREALELFARHLGVVLTVAAAIAAWAAVRKNASLAALALAMPVAAIPFVSVPLLDAIGRDRSSIELAAAIERAAPDAQLVGVAAYPTSLRYYMDRPFLLSSDNGIEMTSNYVASRYAEFRKLPGSPLRPAGWWHTAMAACTTPLVFIVRDDSPEVSVLAARLPRIASGGASGRFIAYGPCRAAKPAEDKP